MPSKQELQFPLKNNQFLDQSALLFLASISSFSVPCYASAPSFCSYLALILSLNVQADIWLSLTS